jgi:hypothetical protein
MMAPIPSLVVLPLSVEVAVAALVQIYGVNQPEEMVDQVVAVNIRVMIVVRQPVVVAHLDKVMPVEQRGQRTMLEPVAVALLKSEQPQLLE